MARLLLASLSVLVLALGARSQVVGDSGNFTYVSARHGYAADDEASVNTLINNVFGRFYEYTAMMAYFKRDDQDLHGFAKFFKRLALEKKECAFKLIKYQTMRGGTVSFSGISAPDRSSYGKGLDAFTLALNYEKNAYDDFNNVYGVAVKNNDAELAFEIEKDVHHQVNKVKEIAAIVRDLQRASFKHGAEADNNFGDYSVDRELEKKEKEHEKHKNDKHCKKHHKKHHGK